jgi:thymidylate synthase (FAD)|tara:strand:- start:15316 stop:15984 length:669 start_codon:yes stop_codon:yes gene_type:complete
MNNVNLVAYTQVEIPDLWKDDPQYIMAYCARVSNPSNQNNTETSEKLLNYCVKNKHWSVFEMCNVILEINTTRDIARQILRHRSFHFQEFSQRYADPNALGFKSREFRLQDTKNRQNSIEVCGENEMANSWIMKQEQLIHETKLAYKWAIQNGIAKEQARSVLPEGLTMSRMYMNGTVRDWIHYCQLRMGNGTQKEHREVASECWDLLIDLYPFLGDIEFEK